MVLNSCKARNTWDWQMPPENRKRHMKILLLEVSGGSFMANRLILDFSSQKLPCGIFYGSPKKLKVKTVFFLSFQPLCHLFLLPTAWQQLVFSIRLGLEVRSTSTRGSIPIPEDYGSRFSPHIRCWLWVFIRLTKFSSNSGDLVILSHIEFAGTKFIKDFCVYSLQFSLFGMYFSECGISVTMTS